MHDICMGTEVVVFSVTCLFHSYSSFTSCDQVSQEAVQIRGGGGGGVFMADILNGFSDPENASDCSRFIQYNCSD